MVRKPTFEVDGFFNAVGSPYTELDFVFLEMVWGTVEAGVRHLHGTGHQGCEGNPG
jgi:hypothetical protein